MQFWLVLLLLLLERVNTSNVGTLPETAALTLKKTTECGPSEPRYAYISAARAVVDGIADRTTEAKRLAVPHGSPRRRLFTTSLEGPFDSGSSMDLLLMPRPYRIVFMPLA